MAARLLGIATRTIYRHLEKQGTEHDDADLDEEELPHESPEKSSLAM
jgi:hypothetical protein